MKEYVQSGVQSNLGTVVKELSNQKRWGKGGEMMISSSNSTRNLCTA